ncbi:HlyD family type I secretion periplasmic adaptor subunit [Rouxiella sp. Mn2063]|uniref:HlyD family type I secretion periplasmic adaptor subunit n=1 Tax=Rouxiella sp. Mn2063 TaxID=3395262 RepID=UPI003BEE4B53
MNHDAMSDELLDERRFLRLGWLVIILGLGSAFIWSAFAPLDKGVASPGSVIVSGNRKTIQAPASGVVKDILVNDGDRVKAGQVLLELSSVQALAQVGSLRDQYYNALASESRLLAEQQDQDKITFSKTLTAFNDQPRVQEIIALQTQLFSSRRLALKSEIDGNLQSIDGMRMQLKGLQDSQLSKQVQISTLSEQMRNLKSLTAEGYVPRNRYLELQRQYADVRSGYDETLGRIGQLQKQLQETKYRIDQRLADYQRDVRTELARTQLEVNDTKNRLDTADFDLGNTVIKSPVDGTVMGKNIFTRGGVVTASDHLMDVVPSQSNLVVDTHLQVNLIDKVYNGLPVDLMFTALNQSRTPRIQGTVSLVSADRLTDKNTGEPYYQMQVTVTPEGMKALNVQDIKPGMSVEVFVKTGSRSLLNYLFKPIVDRASTALTEE